MLEGLLEHGGLGHLLNLQAQLANAPATLAGYLGIRTAIQQFASLDPPTRFAVQLTVSTALRCDYSEALNAMLLLRAGADPADVTAMRAGTFDRDDKLVALLAVAREAGSQAGRVSDETWSAAKAAGWTDTELAEAFACIALAVFVDYFIAYAETTNDVTSIQSA